MHLKRKTKIFVLLMTVVLLISGPSFFAKAEGINQCTHGGENFDIEILTKSETFYAYIQRYAIYPEILVAQKTSKKESFFNIIKFCFKKEKAKSYVFSGIVLLILSFFFRYNLYYVIVSSLLFLCSIICFFQKQKQT